MSSDDLPGRTQPADRSVHGAAHDSHGNVYRSAFDAAVIGMAIVSLDGCFLAVNQALTELTGYTVDELVGRTFQSITHPEDLAADLAFVGQLLAGEVATYQMEKRYLHKDGHHVWIQLSVSMVRDEHGAPAWFIGQMQDITQRKRAEAQLLHQAFHDPLTKLPNRALFRDRVEHALARNQRAGTAAAVLFLDLDNFKVINDSLGHRAGDQLLIEMAERLQGCVRPGDTVARLGGDEFTILLEQVSDVSDAVRVAQRVAEQSLTLYTVGERQVAVSASIGIAVSNPGALETADDLLRDADTAMYEAKRRGRARYEVFSPRLRANARERLELELALQRGIERGELRLVYQPVMDLATCMVTGVEALARWHSPEHGDVAPAVFIPIAEESGLSLPLGDLVLRRACRQLRRWQLAWPAARPLTLSVNLSTRQFLQATLVDDVARVLRETELDPSALVLEITEQVVMEDAEAAIETLRRLEALGVTLAIDDFGTGYSSLAYLRRFPVDVIKIDRTFVSGINRDPEATAIVDAVVAIGRSLGISVVAEGIESADQLEHLRALGCDRGQGFHISDPLTEADLETFLRGQEAAVASLPLEIGAAHGEHWRS